MKDSWGQSVVRGQFAFYSTSGAFIRVVPAGGKSKVKPAAETFLKQRPNEPIFHLVLNTDDDRLADPTDPAAASAGPAEHNERVFLSRFDEQCSRDDDGDWLLDGGQTVVSFTAQC